MKELHGQALSNELAESDRIAAGIPGQVSAKNILFSKFWNQLKRLFGVTVWEAREFKSSPALVVVDNIQYILNEDLAPLPFTSTDFATELSAGKWINLGGVTDHGDLNGLDDDDHLQYLSLSPRSENQVIENQTIELGSVDSQLVIANDSLTISTKKNNIESYLYLSEGAGHLRHETWAILSAGPDTAISVFNGLVQIRINGKITLFNNNGSISNAWLTDQLANKQTIFPGICQTCWLNENDIVLDETNRTVTIPTFNGGLKTINSTNVYHAITDGDGNSTVHPFTSQLQFSWTDTNGVWYFYIDANGDLISTQTPWNDFNIIAPHYRIYWNNTLVASKKIVRAIPEYHPNTISADDHDWKHSYGAIWQRGLDIYANPTTGTPNADGRNTVLAFSGGTWMDDNLRFSVIHATGGTANYTQDLGNQSATGLTISNSGLFPVRINDAGGLLYFLDATRFPFAFNAATNVPQYITVNGTRTDVSANYYFVYWVYAFQDVRRGQMISVISHPTQFANATDAAAARWEDVLTSYATMRDKELRVLYKGTWQYKTAYDAAIKYSALTAFNDFRQYKPTNF